MTRARDMANIAAGSFDVPSVADGIITSAKLASGAITSAALPSGSVLQVVYDSTSVGETTTQTSSTNQTTSALSVNITPKSTSSKILLMVDIQSYVGINGANVYYNIFRDGTRITTDGNAMRHFVAGGTAVMSAAASFVDSPSTTSQVTYDIRYYVSAGTGYVSVNNGQSQITAMEIAG